MHMLGGHSCRHVASSLMRGALARRQVRERSGRRSEAAASKKPIMRRAIAGPNTAPPSATVCSARSSSACLAPLTRLG